MLLQLLPILYLLHYTAAQRRPFNPVAAPRPSGPAPGGAVSGDILSQVSDIRPDGSFYTKYETSNGITFEETGQPKALGQEVAEQVQGSASWTTNEGERVSITWLADENGVVFQGDHLPTPPPTPEIPPLIQRALEWIAANPSKGDDEGQYREEDDGARPPQQALLQRRPPPPRRF